MNNSEVINMYVFNDRINCNTCKHGWHMRDASDFDPNSFCALCGAGHCYMCAYAAQKCLDYEIHFYDEEKKQTMLNLIRNHKITTFNRYFTSNTRILHYQNDIAT